jgi:probable addiction module antidote protein
MMKKNTLKTTKWDAIDYLKTDQDVGEYLEAAIEDGDPALISAALGDIARAKGMTAVTPENRNLPQCSRL